jgi:hypothetical protein
MAAARAQTHEARLPALFTLMFDHLVDYLRYPVLLGQISSDSALDEGVHVHGRGTVRALLYADNVVLVARSQDGLQALQRRLRIFCILWQLEVNVAKTKLMVAGRARPAHAHAPINMFGGQLECFTAYKYLEIVFEAQHGDPVLEQAA